MLSVDSFKKSLRQPRKLDSFGQFARERFKEEGRNAGRWGTRKKKNSRTVTEPIHPLTMKREQLERGEGQFYDATGPTSSCEDPQKDKDEWQNKKKSKEGKKRSGEKRALFSRVAWG